MNKTRASHASFQAALIGLVCVQLACSRLQQATSLPAQPMPAAPQPANTPTSIPAVPPTPTRAPTQPPPATPPVNLPTPAAQINLKETGDRLWGSTSFVFDFQATTDSGNIRLMGKRFNFPEAWDIRKVESNGSFLLEYISIGKRQWATLVDGKIPVSCEGWKEKPTGSLEYSACNAGEAALPLLLTSLAFIFKDQAASLALGISIEEGLWTYQYQWTDTDGNPLSLFVSAESGWPVKFEGINIVLTFSWFNDPGNLITPPVAEMPEKLYLDDARMALSQPYSFQYKTSADMGEPANKTRYTIQGVYIALEAGWQATWKWLEADPKPFAQFLSRAGNKYVKTEGMTMWFPALGDMSTMVGDASPFANWPNIPEMQVGAIQPGEKRSVVGQECQDYLFEADNVPNETNRDMNVRLILCVVPDTWMPLWMEFSGNVDAFTMLITREFSHFDDPGNVIETP